jgi:hypothetical protein
MIKRQSALIAIVHATRAVGLNRMEIGAPAVGRTPAADESVTQPSLH